MTGDDIRRQLQGFRITYISEQTGVHYNTIQRFMAGADVKISTAEKLKKWLQERNQ